MCSNPFCLGEFWYVEWDCCSSPPPSKKKKTTKAPGGRFATPLSPKSMEQVCRGVVPKNTKKCTSWALRVFEEWRTERNSVNEESCPENLLEEPKSDLLNYWLARFVVEIRRPPLGVYILAGLYRYCRECVNHCSAVNHFLGDTDTHTAGIGILRAAVAVLRIPSSAVL